MKSECPTGTIGRHAISLAVGIAVIADACADATPADVLDDAADGADMMGWMELSGIEAELCSKQAAEPKNQLGSITLSHLYYGLSSSPLSPPTLPRIRIEIDSLIEGAQVGW